MMPERLAEIQRILETEHQATVTAIALQVDSPTVYLLEEIHSSDALIDDNIAISKTLVRAAGVTLIGVEGCAGDRISLQDFKNPSLARYFGGRPKFALAMLRCSGLEVVGVDSPELCNQIREDCEEGRWNAGNHPAEELRSKHMARIMITTILARVRPQAAILNAGARHIDDINKAVMAEPDEVGAKVVSFVRVRSRKFPL